MKRQLYVWELKELKIFHRSLAYKDFTIEIQKLNFYRRQDSSQSNASSVLIPPMPDTLPNLMAASNSSILHIENLTDQRPSTVPAIDSFINHHQQDLGLGGGNEVNVGQSCQISKASGSRQVLRGIQSSLSSSMRARTTASMVRKMSLQLNVCYFDIAVIIHILRSDNQLNGVIAF